ncbi:DUF2169 domain-containing protein [Candidatus Curculioniphilus buchneri]|uniref:DUF2169 family type VI secretion system accessory protein n=1 Tax=Candidatus Curculioniphilus buchneri TaxID=690594 RepID=UPI00376F1F84
MRIIKPLRLSVLTRPWYGKDENKLSVAVLVLADISTSIPRIVPEPELWKMVTNELASENTILDMVFPKACPEFLATGYAYTTHQTEKCNCMVSIKVGTLEKNLLITGERFWLNGTPSAPFPFEKLRLEWKNTYGGVDFPENPLGIGSTAIIQEGIKFHPLPRIEYPNHLLGPNQHITIPANFGPLDLTWPRQYRRLGNLYDQKWLKESFPGFSNDMDWHFFNRAEQDQWWPNLTALPLGTSWRIVNMNQNHSIQEGVLPSWQTRCFITRTNKPNVLEEIFLQSTTLWFFPHLERMLLIWHGSCVICQDDASDIAHLIAAMELNGTTLPLTHYHKVIYRRLNKKIGAAYALCDQDLMPIELISPWLDTLPSSSSNPLFTMLSRRGNKIKNFQTNNYTEDITENNANFLKKPTLNKVPKFIESISDWAEKLQQQATQNSIDLKNKVAMSKINNIKEIGPTNYLHLLEFIKASSEKKQSTNLKLDVFDETDFYLDKNLKRSLYWIYRNSTDSRHPISTLSTTQSFHLRKKVQQRLETGGDCRAMLLTGADLSGMDLHGGDFREALMESVILDHCCLDYADLRGTMLAHASLMSTSLNHSRLENACLAGIRCRNSLFIAAKLSDNAFQKADIEDCRFDQAIIKNITFRQFRLYRCNFQNAIFSRSIFIEFKFKNLNFSHCQFSQITFLQGSLHECDFSATQMTDCAFIDVSLDNVCFQRGRLKDCVFSGDSRFIRSNFRKGILKHVNFRNVELPESNFHAAHAYGCDFSQANLSGACLTEFDAPDCLFIHTNLSFAQLRAANFNNVLLQKSCLIGADLRAASLFRADLSQVIMDHSTQLDGAYLEQAKTLPKMKNIK